MKTSRTTTKTAGILFLGFLLLLAVTPKLLRAEDLSIYCWQASIYDLDGDGFADYFAHKRNRVEFLEGTYTDAEALTCPAGWVKSRGDLDDSDPSVHPRRFEVAFNDVDDNCDGRIDEPTLYYFPDGYNNTTTGFMMALRINDSTTRSYYESPFWDVFAKVEYQKLSDTSVTMRATGALPRNPGPNAYKNVHLRLSGLDAATPYRARVQFVTRWHSSSGKMTPVGEQSTWYYSITDSSSSTGQARTRIVLQAFFEHYLSEISYTGYLGSMQDGRRYAATVGEWWCSEFYSWVTLHELEDMGSRSNTGRMVEYFNDRSSWFEIPVSQQYLIGFARPGDYLGVGSGPENIYHSAMFLAYEAKTGQVWSIDGNVSGHSDIGDSYSNRRAGSETVVVHRGSDKIVGFGMIRHSMLRD